MCYGQEFMMFGSPMARIHFVENPGMAFGMTLGGKIGKLVLSLFRLLAISFLFYLLRDAVRKYAPWGFVICLSLLIAGATGNMIDSAFYGLVFSESSYHCIEPATFLPANGGYAGFLQGKVVDMFYFPLFEFVLPTWLPFWGGQTFSFFDAVFNVADSAITVGIITLLLFYRRFINGINATKDEPQGEAGVEPSTPSTPETPVA